MPVRVVVPHTGAIPHSARSRLVPTYTVLTMALKVLIFVLLLSTALALPEPEPDPEEATYGGDYDYEEEEEETVDYGQIPEFMYPESQNLEGEEGGKVTIPCQLSKDSPYVLIVKKEKTPKEEEILLFVGEVKVLRSRRYKLDKGMVEISSLRPSDSGNYVCRIQVDPHIEVVHHLNVKYSPRIIHRSEPEQHVMKDESVTLECEASGNPTPTIRWSRKEGRLPSGAEEEEGLSMTLEGVDRHVEGTYICTADNGIGEPKSATMSIFVTYPPEIITEKTTVRTGEGDKVEMVCIVHARPAPQVAWSKDGRPIEEPGHVEELDKGHRHSLQISDVTESDFGKYECEASNDLGSSSASIHLTGYPKPPHVTSDPNGGEETSYTLTWETESYYPILEYRLRYRKAKANVSSDLPGDWLEGTYEATDLETEGLVHRMKHTIDGLQPATDYHAAIQVKNKFTWSANTEYAFSTKKVPPTTTTTINSSAIQPSTTTSTLPPSTLAGNSRPEGGADITTQELAVHQMTDGAPACSLSALLFLLPTLLLLST